MQTVEHSAPTAVPLARAVPQVSGPPRHQTVETIVAGCVNSQVGEDGVCVLTFDRPQSSANIFDRGTLEELNDQLDLIITNPRINGLIINSAKDSIFIAGADIHSFISTTGADELREMVELGQMAFNCIASMPFPTVAAIHGAALGGGLEIALACDYRVASPERATRLGLPETQLGILPAWGGATRLPHLVGLPRALDLILAGKVLNAQGARRIGLVDDLVARSRLLEIARKKIHEGKPHRSPHRLTNNLLVATVLAARLRPQLLKKTRGHYPAVIQALAVVTKGVASSVRHSLEREEEALLELAQTETSRNLVRVLLLQERARKRDHPGGDLARTVKPVLRTAVVGAGIMGAGIAQWLCARELPVILRDINGEQVAKGMSLIARLLEDAVQRRALSRIESRDAWDRVLPAPNEVPLHRVDVIIEAAVEKMDLKKDIFARLAEITGPDTILATNTSALSVSEIAAATRAPERVIGLHFFNPVHRMQLVEVVVGKHTHPDVVRRALKFTQQIGKLPVVVRDSPGFLVNRVLMPYLIEAGHLFEHGARPVDIDEAMLDFGMPMGPLRLIDEVGVDVCRHVAQNFAGAFGERVAVPPVLERLLEAGWLGCKSGRGFYVHRPKGGEAKVNAGINQFRQDASAGALTRSELQQRLVLLLVNETARCLEESVVAEAADSDFGMIMGTGFAPFRGGPLRYADSTGIQTVVDAMRRLAEAGEPRFAPCPLLEAMAAEGRRFYED